MNDSAHLSLRNLAIGILATGTRRETDSMGDIEVPADRYWGQLAAALKSRLPASPLLLPIRLSPCERRC